MTTQADIHSWFADDSVRTARARPIAENVLALIITPLIPDPNDPEKKLIPMSDYIYDSRLHQYQPGGTARFLRHQLPPALELTLIATDELSWQLYETLSGATAESDLSTEINNRFELASDYETDLDELRTWMMDRKLKPRIFRTTISIRAARFTTEVDA